MLACPCSVICRINKWWLWPTNLWSTATKSIPEKKSHMGNRARIYLFIAALGQMSERNARVQHLNENWNKKHISNSFRLTRYYTIEDGLRFEYGIICSTSYTSLSPWTVNDDRKSIQTFLSFASFHLLSI